MSKRGGSILSRWLSTGLSFALLLQLGTVHAAAADQGDTADETPGIAVADSRQGDLLEQELRQNNNPVSRYVNVFDGKEKVIIWVQGIHPPSIGTSDAELQPQTETVNGMTYTTYQTKYLPGQGWYDVNKSKG